MGSEAHRWKAEGTVVQSPVGGAEDTYRAGQVCGRGVGGELGDRAGSRPPWAFGATVKTLDFILDFR